MLKNIDGLLHSILLLEVSGSINIEKVEPFIRDQEQHYRVYLGPDSQGSGGYNVEVPLSKILLFLANLTD